MRFGETIKLLREELNISREELANKLKVSYSTISKYETNVIFPDNETLQKLADFFNVSVDFLLGRSDVRNNKESGIVTKAFHDLDINGLPEDAIKQVEEYIEFIKLKYNSDGSLRK